MLWKRFVLAPHERGLVTKNGRFGGIFAPGEYAMCLPLDASLEIERHDVREIVFRSNWTNYLLHKRPKLSRRHFQCVETNAVQIAMVYVDGKLFKVLTPSKRMLFWRDAATVTAELVEVVGGAADRAESSPALKPSARSAERTWAADDEIQNCLLFLHSRLARDRSPGKFGCEITRQEIESMKDSAAQLSAIHGPSMAGCFLRGALSLHRTRAAPFDQKATKRPVCR